MVTRTIKDRFQSEPLWWWYQDKKTKGAEAQVHPAGQWSRKSGSPTTMTTPLFRVMQPHWAAVPCLFSHYSDTSATLTQGIESDEDQDGPAKKLTHISTEKQASKNMPRLVRRLTDVRRMSEEAHDVLGMKTEGPTTCTAPTIKVCICNLLRRQPLHFINM